MKFRMNVNNWYGGVMSIVHRWWNNDLPQGVKVAFFVLLANALPAITILMTLPTKTETLFVWTINPVINARLIGVMYSNAILLVGIGLFQKSWARVRVIMVVITLFSILATILTFIYLKPFLAHPWFHLAFWLSMYLALVLLAPYIFITQERQTGGRLPVQNPLSPSARGLALMLLGLSVVVSAGLLLRIDLVNQRWPWQLPPLVGGLIGVLLATHAAAYAWALWDGDWQRVQPIFWQAPITGFFFLILPLLHPADLKLQAESSLQIYLIITSLVVVVSLAISMNQHRSRIPVAML
jgi:hypothetical protein